MKLRELLQLIEFTSKKIGTSPVFLCGGAPRDKLMGRLDQLVDLDLTTGDNTVHVLAKEISRALRDADYRVMDDGHAQITFNGFKFDFSSNFQVPGIEKYLQKAGITNPDSMQRELYSRDFTCNALLLTMDLKTIKDPTGLGVSDIENKIIRTCLPAALTLGSQNKRVPRIFYLAAKLDFEVDNEIIEWVAKNPQSIANCKPKYLVDKLQKALYYDREKTISLLDQMDLWKFITVMPELVSEMNLPTRI
jgi:tRNA nucleotidyltransferase/poly(A) polymerase